MFHNFSAVTYDETPRSADEFDLNSGLTGSELCGAIWSFASTQSHKYAPGFSRGVPTNIKDCHCARIITDQSAGD
jgi:hypothetical protein